MPALSPYIIEPIWEQFAALLPERKADHPLGCHRPRVPDGVVFEKLVVQVLVFGCALLEDSRWLVLLGYHAACRSRREEWWIEAGAMDALEEMVREAYERTIGLELSDLAVDWDIAVDCCITKAPCGGGGESWRVKARWSGERGASNALGGRRCRWGIPLGYITAPGQPPRLAALVRDPGHRVKASGSLPEPARTCIWTAATTRTSPASGWRRNAA